MDAEDAAAPTDGLAQPVPHAPGALERKLPQFGLEPPQVHVEYIGSDDEAATYGAVSGVSDAANQRFVALEAAHDNLSSQVGELWGSVSHVLASQASLTQSVTELQGSSRL